MFRSPNVQVNLSPVIRSFAAAKLSIILRVHITEKIPAATGITGHCIGFKRSSPPTPRRGDFGLKLVDPVFNVSQRSFAFGAGFVAVYMRQDQGQFFFI